MVQKKVAVVIAALAGGGVERMMIHLVESLNDEPGIEAELMVISDLGEDVAQHKLPEDFPVVYLHKKRVVSGFFGLTDYLRSPDISAVISAQEHVNLLVVWALKLTGKSVPFVPVVHNTLSIKLGQSQKFGDQVLIPLCRWFYPRLKVLGVVSQGVKKDLVDFIGVSPGNVRVLPNPVVNPEMWKDNDFPAMDALSAPNFSSILGVGRLVKAKGFDLLIRAYALIADESDLPLMILGEGPEREFLEKLIADLDLEKRITLPGWIRSPWPFMQSAKLFVLSSREEGLPTVLIEAMAHGTPVVATDCRSGPREILDEGKFGRLVAVGDVEALAQAMIDTLEHPLVSSKELIERGMLYSYENSRNAYLSLISELEQSND